MNLKFYRADLGYGEFLLKADPCVPCMQSEKNMRPFVGIVANQLSWCNSNKTAIKAKAEKLHRIIVNGQAPPKLAERCCNFVVVEDKYRKYCTMHGLDMPDVKKK